MEEREKNDADAMGMSPWEQHSGVIKLPRYDYNAPSSLLHNSHSGFLITCTIKREKSATKEAISILHKKKALVLREGSYAHKILLTHVSTTRILSLLLLTLQEMVFTLFTSLFLQIIQCLWILMAGAKSEAEKDGVACLSLVKLTRNGLLLLTFPSSTQLETVNIVSNIIQALESGTVTLPVWCHRIFPIQATCSLNEKELQEVVSRLVKKFLADKQDKLERPLKFAVGFNRRGIDETTFAKENSNDSKAFSLLDRNKCFGVVASAVNHVVEDSVVDLRSPELSVLVELLPLSGVPNGSIIVAVSVLPKNLVSTKPRLCIKALNSNTNEGSVTT